VYDAGPDLPEGAVVVDIGAGLGDFAIHAARRRPSARIFAFEPFRDSFILLEENLAENCVTGVIPFPQAVGARTGRMALQTGTGVAVRHSTAAADTDTSSITVDAVSLNDAFRRNSITRCDLLKVDCEGGEYDILFHASETTISSLRAVAMEYHDGVTGHNHHELEAFFTRNGFSVRTKVNPVHPDIGMLYAAR
jgi:FkbM family methyltransferase